MPQLGVQNGDVERYGASRSGVVGIGDLDPQPSRGETPGAEATSETLTQGPKERMQDPEVIGIGAQGMAYMELALPLGRQHGAGVDATSTGSQYPAAGTEHCA
jgi:hypothetical protein